MRKITAFTRRCRSVASLAFQIAPFASFSFSYVETITTRRYTFERHVWTCALNSGIFCVSAVVSSNSTLKRETIIHHLHRHHHHHHHYHGRRCHHHPASTENRRFKPCIRPARLRFEFRRREKLFCTDVKKMQKKHCSRATFLTGNGIDSSRKGIYNSKSHIKL